MNRLEGQSDAMSLSCIGSRVKVNHCLRCIDEIPVSICESLGNCNLFFLIAVVAVLMCDFILYFILYVLNYRLIGQPEALVIVKMTGIIIIIIAPASITRKYFILMKHMRCKTMLMISMKRIALFLSIKFYYFNTVLPLPTAECKM